MQKQENNVYYAGFFVRLAAVMLDELLIGIILFFVKIPVFAMSMGGITGGPLFSEILFQFTGWDILFYLLAKGYFVAATYSAGATFGKKLMKIKVTSVKGDDLTLWNVIYRETIGKYLSELFLCIGYVIIGIDREKRGFHDMLCDTCVIYNFNDLQIVDVSKHDTGISEFKSIKQEETDHSSQTDQHVHKNDVDIYYRRPTETEMPQSSDSFQTDSKTEAPTYEAASYGYGSDKQEEKPLEEETEK